MPKAAAQSPSQPRPAAAVNANALKRNQACHQCRRKKLRCDANSPCGACIKTHAYAVKTHPATAPAQPECTYDGDEVVQAQVKMQEMEAKIRELENKLHTQPPSSSSIGQPPLPAAPQFRDISAIPSPPATSAGFLSSPQSASGSPPAPSPHFLSLSPAQDVNSVFRQFPDTANQGEARHRIANSLPTPSSSGSSPLLDLTDPGWPANVPGKELLFHLVDTFFACCPHANRVIHKPTFMTQLLEPPTSEKFPHVCVLHAISAIGSLYTPIIVDTMGRPMSHIGPDTLFNSAIVQKRWAYDSNKDKCTEAPDSKTIEEGAFGLTQAFHYQEEWLRSARVGDRLTQLLQSGIIMSWYYHSVGRAVDTWMSISNIIRCAIPMGLNVGPLWTPISRQPAETLSMFPHGADDTTRELLRNLFWLCYTQERISCAGTVWPLILHDDDVTQYLPLNFNTNGFRFVPDTERQRIGTPKMLTTHPAAITDSFTLYIKGSILLGRVKTFNGRFKNKFIDGAPEGLDPRETAEFQMLDNTISAFKLSVPKEYREPTGADGRLDPILYLALILPHVSMLLLHDPYADISSPNCMSAERMLTAARAILDLIYKLTATSFDLMLLDHSCSFCWFVAATALIRFVKAKIMAGDEVETVRLTSEIQVIRFMMSNLGSRTIVGLRQNMILDEMYAAEVQPLIDGIVRATAPPSTDNLNSNPDFFSMF